MHSRVCLFFFWIFSSFSHVFLALVLHMRGYALRTDTHTLQHSIKLHLPLHFSVHQFLVLSAVCAGGSNINRSNPPHHRYPYKHQALKNKTPLRCNAAHVKRLRRSRISDLQGGDLGDSCLSVVLIFRGLWLLQLLQLLPASISSPSQNPANRNSRFEARRRFIASRIPSCRWTKRKKK